MSLNTGVLRLPNQAVGGTSDTGYSDIGFDASGNPATANAAGVVKYLPQSASAAAAAEVAKLGVRGADIASAATLNLEAATGELVDVTGTTGINAITLSEGHRRIVRFTGILTLTDGASLVLLGAANITTAAGDVAVFVGYAAGVVRMAAFAKAAVAPWSAAVTLAQISNMHGDVRTAAANAPNATGGLVTFGGNIGEATAASIVVATDMSVGGTVQLDDGSPGFSFVDDGALNALYLAPPAGVFGSDKTQTFQNASGTVALTSDITGGTLAGSFTTLAASGTVSGAGFAAYLASPPAIGGTSAAAGSFTTITGTSSATLGTNGGTGGSLVLRGSTSGSATINTSATGGLQLGTPTTLVLTNATGLPLATGISGLGSGVASALALATNAVGGMPTKLYEDWNPEEVTLYNSGTPTIDTAGSSTFVGVKYIDGASTYIQFPISAARWAGRTVKMKMLILGNTTEASKNFRLRLALEWRTSALDGATTSAAGPGVGMDGGGEDNGGPYNYPNGSSVSFTADKLLEVTSVDSWTIPANATFISLFFGMERANAGDTYAGTLWSLLFMLQEQ